MNNYSDTYNTFYQSNAASIFCFKSSRKNSKCSDIININHLINRETDRRVSDNRIMDQIAGTIEKIVYYCKQYKHIELSCYMDVFKQIEYENANNEISTLKDNNTSLKQANYELFLRVGKRTEKPDEEHKDPEIKTPSAYIKDIGEYR